MGTKSPIFDIEHLQLFDKPTGAALLRNAGFDSIKVSRCTTSIQSITGSSYFPSRGP